MINPDSGNPTRVSSKSTTELEENDVASVQTPGGGGYGDPTERPAEKVLEDVRNAKVSVEAAREEYGVVIEDGEIDRAATADRAENVSINGGDDQ